jgi:dolichol-phosphate mannosyltransferase
VIPCYDEEEALPSLLPALEVWIEERRLEGRRVEVVFVDDGSTDRTPQLLAGAALHHEAMRVLTHPVNRGVGAAQRTGLRDARGRAVVVYDADRTYPLDDVARLADGLADADVVTASPFLPGAGVEGVPWRRLVLTRGAALAYRLVLGGSSRGVVTFTCAFRAYRGDLARGIEFDADGFPAAAEILGRLMLAGARVVEVPSVLSVREAGTSRLRVVRTIRGHLEVLLRLLRWHPPRPKRQKTTRTDVPDATRVAELNRELPMRLLEEHGNPVVRAVEARRRRSILGLAAPAPGQRALDVGSEEGHLARPLEGLGARVVRVDLDPAVLAGAPPGTAVAADAERLPFAPGSFDRVVLAAVLEHVPDPRRAAREAVRVARSKGRVVVSVPHDRIVLALKRTVRALGLGRLLGGLSPGLAPGHVRVYTPAKLREDLVAAGLVRRLIRDPLGLSIHAVMVTGNCGRVRCRPGAHGPS